jgi:phosphoribosyl-ATP pyrophosphohydrolase/phosphoribosyl-AMP cyclohydrolase
MSSLATFSIDALDFTKGNGLVTVIAQDARSGTVLMVAHANREALERTIATGEMHYTSRTRGLWHKGATSGNVQQVVSLSADCDGDALLARVISAGPACHTGTTSCFGDAALSPEPLAELDATIAQRKASLDAPASDRPSGSWTQKLLLDANLRHKKLGEEAVELTMACMNGDTERAIEETADLVYHAMVALNAAGGRWSDVQQELHRRATKAR